MEYSYFVGMDQPSRSFSVPVASPEAVIKKAFPLIRAGELYKKGGERQNWKKRWFELRKHSLAYFASRKVCSLGYDLSNLIWLLGKDS